MIGKRCVVLTSIVLTVLFQFAFATPYIDPEILDADLRRRRAESISGPNRVGLELDELDEYNYFTEYEQILDWLTGMQVETIGANFGGMREGELDWNIIQTDNTQEALRDWCRYGRYTGDTTLYREYIDAAWEYCLEWPAWLEEGGGNPNYYRVHNTGWGLVAAMEYEKTYNDTTYKWYGDECADYLDTYRLTVNTNSFGTNPLSSGFGAGALYLYGVWRENQDWMDAAQEIAEDVQAWIEFDPDRLNDAESWAMSGGTAMWGVVTALFSDDHEAGELWIPDIAESMDTYAGPGNWNNSWTIWYGHAWNAIHQVLGDEQSFLNVMECADNLLDQDEEDDDGGVPATENQWDNDQSWTSAYICWYALEMLFDVPPDASIEELVYPSINDTVNVRQAVDFIVEVRNAGSDSMESVDVNLTVGEFTASGTIDLNPFQTTTLTLEPRWYPLDSGEQTVFIEVTHELDTNAVNDTLSSLIYVDDIASISGFLTAESDGSPVRAKVDFVRDYAGDERTLVYTTLSDPETGHFYQEITDRIYPLDIYSLEITPFDIPFAYHLEEEVRVTIAQPFRFLEFEIQDAEYLYVTEEPEGIYDHLYLNILNEDFHTFHPLRLEDRPLPALDDLLLFEAILWSTGDQDYQIINGTDRMRMIDYLDNGGNVMLNGWHIMNLYGGFNWMRTEFGVDQGELDLADTTITMGPAAINGTGQYGADEVVVAADSWGYGTIGSTAWYSESGLSAGVYYVSPVDSHKTVTYGFGLEGLSGSESADAARATLIARLTWMTNEYSSVQENVSTSFPSEYALYSAYPNPFNPVTTISYDLPQIDHVQLTVFDILGRKITVLADRQMQAGQHQVTFDGSNLASGIYFVSMNAGDFNSVQKVMLLKQKQNTISISHYRRMII